MHTSERKKITIFAQKKLMMDDNAMQKLSYGLFVVTAHEGGKDNGCITNTVSQVTIKPNRITLVVDKSNYTHDMIVRTGKFNVSILSEDASFDTFKHWGFQSGRTIDKAAGIEFSRADNGVIYITSGVNAVLCAKVDNTIDLGTHSLFIASVEEAFCLNETPSATSTYYHEHIKPAPEKPKKKGWICVICGYIYEGEILPEDYICPLCKHPASDFKPLE